MQGIFESFGRMFLSRTRMRQMDSRLAMAGLDMPPEAFAGLLLMVILLLSVALAAVALDHGAVFTLLNPYLGISGLTVFVVYLFSLIVSYITVTLILSSLLIVKSDTRRNALEQALPDFLLLVSSNVKAGMPLDQGMWYAAKPEFGLLSIEVRTFIKRSFSGESLEDALDTLAKRFDSKVFSRTITLVKQASATGGEISEVLESTASDVRDTNIMKKEVAASLVLYEIFVLFAGVAGTPFLFAVAGKLIRVFEFRGTGLPTSTPPSSLFGTSSFTLAEPAITSSEFFYFSIATIFITALFSSFIVGVIRRGSKNEGIKYFPFVLVLAYLVFFITDSFLSSFFSGLGGV